MRKAVRAIIIHENKLLVMHRNKFGKEYYNLVGGGIKFGETASQALTREVHEEAGVAFNNARLVFVQEAGDPYGTQYVFLCDYVSGEPRLDPTSAEASINELGKNLYEPRWLTLSEFPKAPFVADVLKEAILEGIHSGFPTEPKVLYGS